MKLTDYIADFLAKQGVRHAFGVTGGAVVHFFDSLNKHPDTQPVFLHHEQSASFAAESYARVTNNLGVCFVTTGPGGTNAITGLCAAWLDSVPCIFISGQQRLEHSNHRKPYRQMGSQQIDIIPVVQSLTKYAVLLEDPKMIRYELEKAAYLAKSGRPGPVWLDIPLGFQWMDVDPATLPSFTPDSVPALPVSVNATEQWTDTLAAMLGAAKRPIVIAGYGIRLAHDEEAFRQFVTKYQLPFVTTWNTLDIMSSDHELYVGCCGIAAQRSGNFAVQNSDLILAIGSHLSMCITGSNFDAFARDAKRIVVNIDPVQLDNPTVRVDLSIQSDAGAFLNAVAQRTLPVAGAELAPWKQRCAQYKTYNRPKADVAPRTDYVDPYVFLDRLSDALTPDDTIAVDGGGTALYMSFQGIRMQQGQRLVVGAGIGCMGSGLPESVGACFAANKGRTFCTIGDGSLQFNIQELQTLVHHQLPVKILCFNNDGYLSIRITQDGFLDSKYIGSDKSGGITMPQYEKVAQAYGVTYVRVANDLGIDAAIRTVLDTPGPVLCEIMVDRDQELIPRLGFKMRPNGTGVGMPLEDMAPFLSREEFLSNMVIAPLPECVE